MEKVRLCFENVENIRVRVCIGKERVKYTTVL